jgi:hypothetical protein
MAQIQRKYNFTDGQKLHEYHLDEEFNNLVQGNNTLDTDVQGHKGKQAVTTSTDTVKDKHVSNAQAKKWEDHANSSSNPHNTTASQVGAYSKTESNDRYYTKTEVDSKDSTIQGQVTQNKNDISSLDTRTTQVETLSKSNENRATNLENNKTDKLGDHKGTWNGLTPPELGAGDLNASRISLIEEELNNQKTQTITLQNGVNSITSTQHAPVDLILAKGATLATSGEGIKGVVNPTIENTINQTSESFSTILHGFNGVYDELVQSGEGYQRIKHFREITLDGSLPWVFDADFTGFKRVKVSGVTKLSSEAQLAYMSKHDNSILQKRVTWDSANLFLVNAEISITLSDADTGLSEAYSGTTVTVGNDYANAADMIKAYFNAWKWTGSSWVSIYNSGVTSSSILEVITRNLHRENNKTGYKLVYKLESEEIAPVNSNGKIILETGSNELVLKQGLIVKEKVNPAHYSVSYLIGDKNEPSGYFKFKPKRIVAVYENDKPFTKYTVGNTNVQGLEKVVINEADFNKSATYHVTYEVMDEVTATLSSADITYEQNISSLVDEHTRDIANHKIEINNLPTVYAKREQSPFIRAITQNGWLNSGRGLHFMKDDFKFVHLHGNVSSGTNSSWTVVATLPKGYRPPENFYAICRGYNGTVDVPAYVRIDMDGAIKITSGNGGLTSIEFTGINFKWDGEVL